MDLLAMYQPRASVPLDELAKLIGFPGKLGMDGSKVWQAHGRRAGVSEIRDYCETDALNTYLVSRALSPAARRDFVGRIRRRRCALVRSRSWRQLGKPHWQEFLAAWQ
jgi:predicted PolB exonuclease-like 3'-5' exonuclease